MLENKLARALNKLRHFRNMCGVERLGAKVNQVRIESITFECGRIN